jgi:hypothetical protein
VTGVVRARAIRPKWSRPISPGCDSRSPALSGRAGPWRREASETNATAEATTRMRDPGRAGDATCKMRDGSRLRNPRSCRHHVRASLKDFAQSKASLFAYSLASPVSPSPLSQLCVDRFDLAFFSCTISDPRSSPPSVPPLSSPTEDCHCARLSCLPARQRWTPFRAMVLIRQSMFQLLYALPHVCGQRRESVACHRLVERCARSQAAKSPLGEVDRSCFSSSTLSRAC